MNPGYVSYIALSAVFILICSGWIRQVAGAASPRSALSFCAAWTIASMLLWRLPGSAVSGTFVYAPLIGLVFASLRRDPAVRGAYGSASREQATTGLALALLSGAGHSLVQAAEQANPLWIVAHPAVDPAALSGALIICYTSRPVLQLAMISVGLIADDIFMAALHRGWEGMFLGGREFQDRWWATAAAVRLVSECAAALRSAFITWHPKE